MPITSKIKGNLITLAQEGRYKAIMHGCNCFCVFGSGLAPQIAASYPMAEAVDNRTIRGDKLKLGTYTVSADLAGNGVIIINAYIQYSTGGRAKGLPDIGYKALADVFALINKRASGSFKEDPRPIGIPQLGAGLALGHWDAIEVIINLVTPDLNFELVIFDGK